MMRSPLRIAATYLRYRHAWESICTHCGHCCFERRYARTPEGETRIEVDFDEPCPYLDLETRLCTVYDERFAINPRCHRMTLRQAVFADHLPPTCGYRRLFDRP